MATVGVVTFNKDPAAGGERNGSNSWHGPAPQRLRVSPVVAWGDMEGEGDGSGWVVALSNSCKSRKKDLEGSWQPAIKPRYFVTSRKIPRPQFKETCLTCGLRAD